TGFKPFMNKKLLVFAVLAMVGGTIARADIVEQILVKVNGDIFTKTDLENLQVQALRQRGQAVDLKSEQADAQLRKALDEVTPQLLVNVVDDMLIVQRGRELGYKLTDEQFKNAIESIKRDNKIENDEQFQAALKQENMTMADLRRNFEKQMIRSRVEQNEVFGKVGVSEDEARKYYDSHLAEFTTPPAVTLREILVAVPSDGKTINVGKDDDAKAKAEQTRAPALAGESFEKLAAGVTDSPSPSEQAREQIGDRVFTDKRQAEFLKYLEKLRAEAIIDWKNPEVKKAYEEGIAARAKGVTK